MAGRRLMSRQAMAKRDEEREKRLAEALRENLRRRKAQARGEATRQPGESRRPRTTARPSATAHWTPAYAG